MKNEHYVLDLKSNKLIDEFVHFKIEKQKCLPVSKVPLAGQAAEQESAWRIIE